MRKIMIMLLFAISSLAISAAVNPPDDQDPPPQCAPNCLVAR